MGEREDRVSGGGQGDKIRKSREGMGGEGKKQSFVANWDKRTFYRCNNLISNLRLRWLQLPTLNCCWNYYNDLDDREYPQIFYRCKKWKQYKIKEAREVTCDTFRVLCPTERKNLEQFESNKPAKAALPSPNSSHTHFMSFAFASYPNAQGTPSFRHNNLP